MSATAEQVSTDAVPEADESTPELTADQAYHLLQNERRRAVLRYLRDVEGPVEMRDVAEQVAAWENDTTVQAISSSERQRVYIPLYQSHLPKLDEEGVIDYDKDRGTVRKTRLVAVLNEYLEPTTTTTVEADDANATDAWGRYYLGAAGVGTTVLAGASLGVAPFALLPEATIGVLILGMFWTLTLGQRLTVR